MEDPKAARATRAQPDFDPEPPRWRKALKIFGVLMLLIVGAAVGAGAYINARATVGEVRGIGDIVKGLDIMRVAIREPRKYFPGQDQITVLCLGLDRNIFRSRDPKLNGMPYTKGSRSDVMMVVRLDLAAGTASILSIPRDTRVQLPNKRSFSKINQAHADGGIPYTRKAVEEFLGITIDHHLVIRQEAIEKIVDALQGVKVKVAKDMDYDDNWGQLHIHLKEGEQVLSGEQVVGYLRYRHDAEGDLGRIRRQQQVIQVLSEQVKSPSVLFKASGLIDAVDRHIDTSFTKGQRLALANLFHQLEVGSIQTLSLPIEGTDTIDGISYVIPDDYGKQAAVDWIVNGNPDAMNRLIKVELRNASGDRELFSKVYDCLRHHGFEVIRGRREDGETQSATRAVQLSNLRGAAKRVLEVLGVSGHVPKEDGDPWGADAVVYVGSDMESSSIVSTPELWPEMPVRPARKRYARRTRSRRDEGLVRIRAVESNENTEEPREPETPEGEPNTEPGTPPGSGDNPGGETPEPASPATPEPTSPSGAKSETKPVEVKPVETKPQSSAPVTL